MKSIASKRPTTEWDKREHEEQKLLFGPRYSPAEWFGDGKADPEKWRVKYLKAVHSPRRSESLSAKLCTIDTLRGELLRDCP